MSERADRYTAIAIVLHWAIACAILINLPLGLWMHEQAEHGDTSRGVFEAYQLHKSIGLTVLALSLVRLGWRLMNPPPALPAQMPAWEKLVAKLTHWAFYVLMIGVPLTGWVYVSAGWSVHDDAPLVLATRWFKLFEVPHLFGLTHQPDAVRADAAGASLAAHAYLSYAMIGLAALHVAAALKHQVIDRDEVLSHMVPGLRPGPKNGARLALLGGGLGLTGFAVIAALLVISGYVNTPAPTAPSTFEVVEADTSAGGGDPAPHVETPVAAAPEGVSSWRVNTAQSQIGFSYAYEDDAGTATTFNGRFARWRADIRFDAEDLDHSAAAVTIETASASTGVQAHDMALPGSEWFDASGHPSATFQTTRIRARGAGQYEARGNLTIRGVTKSVDLPFTLTINGDSASMSGRTTIDRRDFGIGVDGSGDEYISNDITIAIRVEAQRAD